MTQAAATAAGGGTPAAGTPAAGTPAANTPAAGAAAALAPVAERVAEGVEFPAPAPSRTPRLLRRLQVVAAVAVLLAGGLATWLIADLRSDLAGAPNLAEQHGRLGQVQHALHTATTLVSHSVLAGEGAGGERPGAARDALAAASVLLVEAARDRPQDAVALGELNAGVLRYAVRLDAVAGSGRTEAVPRLAAVRSGLEALQAQVAELQAQLGTEASTRPWSQGSPLVILGVLAMVAVLGWVSWVLAQRTHRVLNPGLVAAVASLLVIVGLVVNAQSSAGSASDESRGTQFERVVGATEATRQLDTAEQVLTTAVLTRTWDARAEATVADALTAAQEALDRESAPGLGGARTAERALARAAAAGDWAGATTVLLAEGKDSFSRSAGAFRTAADEVVADAVSSAATEPRAAREAMLFSLVATIVLALAGAALGVLGVDRRLREYR